MTYSINLYNNIIIVHFTYMYMHIQMMHIVQCACVHTPVHINAICGVYSVACTVLQYVYVNAYAHVHERKGCQDLAESQIKVF